MATALAALDRFEEAAEAFARHIRLDPEHSCPHWELGRALSYLERYDEALREFEMYVDMEPEDVRGVCSVGVELQNLGRLTEAKDWLTRARSIDPDYPWVWSALARLAESTDDFEEALLAIERAIALLPENPDFRQRRLVLLAKCGRVDEAIRLAQQEPDEGINHALFEVQDALRDLERWDDAIRVARILVHRESKQVWTWGTYGLTLFESDRYEDAVRAFEELLKLDTDDAPAWFYSSLCYAELDTPSDALRCADRTLALDLSNVTAMEVRLWALECLDRTEDARRQAAAILELDPDNEFVREWQEDRDDKRR